mmetsp:Transcript_55589/g.146667  ORF Transcript_55589/g.146667 Transcript_55589/m.146667 type:complete len:108 (+) Transcript_55589:317-640(+)
MRRSATSCALGSRALSLSSTRYFLFSHTMLFMHNIYWNSVQVKVKGWGGETDPLWIFLKQNSHNCCLSREVWWNFEKVLVDKEGKVVKRYGSTTSPASICSDIEKLL